MKNDERRFRAVIEDAGNGGAFVPIPFDVELAYGKKRVKVRATLDGEPYRGSLVRMGGPCHILGILKAIRAKLGKSVGDEIGIVLVEDVEPREVAIPADLRSALGADPAAESAFGRLSYTDRRACVGWIETAKRGATRRARIAEAVGRLVDGRKGW